LTKSQFQIFLHGIILSVEIESGEKAKIVKANFETTAHSPNSPKQSPNADSSRETLESPEEHA